MSVAGIDHLNLRAPRELLDRLRDFYRDIVGLEVGPRPPFASVGYWLYADGKDVLHLTEATERLAARARTCFDHIAFACRDAAACERRLRQAGVAFAADRVPETRHYQLFFRDPAGNGVELNFRADAR